MPPSGRTPIRDNTRLLLAGVAVLLVLLAGFLTLASRSSRLAPDFLTEVVLYALSATNLTMLVALGFVLVRNIVKLLVERRRALPFARFRAKLVALLLAMTIVPAVLVLLVGSEVIRNSIERWFNAPVEEVLSSANAIAGDYYEERLRLVRASAETAASALAAAPLQESSAESVRRLVTTDTAGSGLVEVFRRDAAGGLQPITELRTDQIPASYLAQSGLRLAERAATGEPVSVVEPLGGGGELIRAAAPVLDGARGVRGVVVVSDYLSGQFAARARRTVAAYEDYQQLRVLQQPLTGVYLSFFLMLTLMILVGATWMGLYVAKRITRPVQTLAAAAQEIGAGHLDHRVVAETNDEFGSLIEAFNSMAGKLSQSRRELEASAVALEERHREVEGRRRYVETILERIATGVVSLDGAGRVQTSNSAADRLLGLKGPVAGRRVSDVFDAPELQPLAGLIARAAGSGEEIPPQEVAVSREERELHLAVMTTPLRAGDGRPEGMVVVFDDVTPLIRAQKVAAWREVARRLAHEIKNPLTPIQLCAERMRRHFGDAPSPTRELVDECTATIVGEVESLKELVDEFSQFARMPPPRRMPTDLHQLLGEVLQLYQGLFAEVQIRQVFAPTLPRLSVDPEQMRRVLINLIDNAVEAIGRRGRIDLETHYQPADALVRVVVADDGPGIPAAEREKLFLPYYSTKRRGSGLGLAIVRRIVAEHGGSIEVDDNVPHGTRFSIELPC